MRILTSWLKEFVHFTVPVETLAEDLTMTGLEVEEIEPAYKGLAPVVVCSVEEIVPHPQASHLQVCTVIAGEQKFDVVCGAPNVQRLNLVSAMIKQESSYWNLPVDASRGSPLWMFWV
jgi:phenylalanyl-tRNA synthetase beta chain